MPPTAAHDQGLLCALLSAAGGSVYQAKRLEVGAYALSTGAAPRNDGVPLSHPLSFRFEKVSHAAMADDRLRDTIDYLIFHRLWTETVEEPVGREGLLHGRIHLTHQGQVLADATMGRLRTRDRRSVGEVGASLRDPSVQVGDLLQVYGCGWLASVDGVVDQVLGRSSSIRAHPRRGAVLGSYVLVLPWRPDQPALERISKAIPFLLRDTHSALELEGAVGLQPHQLSARFTVVWDLLDDYRPSSGRILALERLRDALVERRLVAHLSIGSRGYLQWQLRAPAGAPPLRLRSPWAWQIAEEATLHSLGRAPPLIALLRTAPREGTDHLRSGQLVARAWPRGFVRGIDRSVTIRHLRHVLHRWVPKAAFLADPRGCAGIQGSSYAREELIGHFAQRAMALGASASTQRSLRSLGGLSDGRNVRAL